MLDLVWRSNKSSMKKTLYLLIAIAILCIISFSVFSYGYNKHANEITVFAENIADLIEIDTVVEDAKKLKFVSVSLEKGFFFEDDGSSHWEDPSILIESTKYIDAISCRIGYIEKHNLTTGEYFCLTNSASMYLTYE